MTYSRRHKRAVRNRYGSAVRTMLIIVALLTGSLLWQHTTAEAAYTPQARTTQEFLGSMGVIAHLSGQDYADGPGVLAQLQQLGITHVRNNLKVDEDSMGKGVMSAKLLGANGIRLNFTIPRPESTQPTTQDIQQAVDSRITHMVDHDLVQYTESIEPFNEYDDAGVKTWPTVIQEASAYLASQRSRLGDDVKLLGPSLVGYRLKDSTAKYRAAAGGGLITHTFEYGNIHSYYGGQMPESAMQDAAWQDAGTRFNQFPGTNPARTLDDRLRYYAYNISGDKPIIVTEMGYHNYRSATKKNGVDEKTAAIYMPRAYLENFRIGVMRSYAYELTDEPNVRPNFEQYFGFYRADGTPKPSAIAIGRITRLLGRGTTTTPTAFPLGFSGDTNNLRTVLLQKHNNEYYLAVWRQLSVYDVASGKPLTPKATNLTVTLPVTKDIRTFTGFSADRMKQRAYGSTTSVTVPVGAELMLIRMR